MIHRSRVKMYSFSWLNVLSPLPRSKVPWRSTHHPQSATHLYWPKLLILISHYYTLLSIKNRSAVLTTLVSFQLFPFSDFSQKFCDGKFKVQNPTAASSEVQCSAREKELTWTFSGDERETEVMCSKMSRHIIWNKFKLPYDWRGQMHDTNDKTLHQQQTEKVSKLHSAAEFNQWNVFFK